MRWTKQNGEIVERDELRRMVSGRLSREWRSLVDLDRRREALARTVDDDEWLRFRDGETVGSIYRQVWPEMFGWSR